MSLTTRYLQYIAEICEGTRAAPEPIALHETDDLKKAMELQEQISGMGIPAFVAACARQDGTQIPQEEYDAFHPEELQAALAELAAQAEAQAPAAKPAAEEPVKSEIRDIYEVFLDGVCLDDRLVQYLIDILRRGAKDEFATLSHVAARTVLDMDEFLAWLANMELLADEEERACACVMDACLDRLWREGQKELAAALIAGDETTFRIFRAEAPELIHLPQATFAWYCKNYLDRYYPVRFLIRCGGAALPERRKES